MAVTDEQRALALHRFQRAREALDEAVDGLSRNHLRLAVNRAYYSVFYAMRAFLACIDKDSSRHSGVMSLFNQHFIRPGAIPNVDYKAIQLLMDLRHEADYQDFAQVSAEEAESAVASATGVIEELKRFFDKMIQD